MRRVLIWSVLTAIVALALVVAGYWTYWNLFARFQPVTITTEAGEVQELLDSASWLSDGGGGRPVYIISYRDSAAMERYVREEAPRLRAGGAEPRFILFARADRSSPAERATVAELWLSRDWRLFQRWMAAPARSWTAQGVAPADGDLAREAMLGGARRFEAQVGALLSRAGVDVNHPLVLWRDDEGFLKACACADARGWAFVRDDLGAPDRVGDPRFGPEPGLAAEPVPSMGYPDLSGAAPPASSAYPPVAPQAPPPVQAAPDAPPEQPRAARPPPPPTTARRPPRAERQDDALFY